MVFAAAARVRDAFFAAVFVAVFRAGDFFAAVFPAAVRVTVRFPATAGDVPACVLDALVDGSNLFVVAFPAVALSVAVLLDAPRFGFAPSVLSSTTHVGA